jgi:ethanolaminephosphotransferase
MQDTHTNRAITAVDHSLLSQYVLKPYWWSQVINLFPMSMAPNAVCLTAQTRIRPAFLTITTDYPIRLRLCHYKRLHHALLLPKHGPGLSVLGLLVLVRRPLPLPNLRRRGWHSSVCTRQTGIFTRLNTDRYHHRRRTGQSGPLGELFDHGVDALNTSLEVLLFSAAMNFGQGWKTVVVLFGCS